MTSSLDNIFDSNSSSSQSNFKTDRPLDSLVNLLLEREEDDQKLASKTAKQPSNYQEKSDRPSSFREIPIEDNVDENFILDSQRANNLKARSSEVEHHHQAINYSRLEPEIIPEGSLEANLDNNNIEVADLADTVNALIPLIVELINYKAGDTRESILQAVVPVIDRIIEQRSTEDAPKMAAAIAKILPQAISEKIAISPQAIAKAIAPEVALAIEEQIRLDRDAISNALGSEMGKAIKTQIELEKDAMVDALYPVIGNTISKYMVQVVHEINHKVETALSPEGLKRKIRAKLQGVSEAELILSESVRYHVQAVFLIEKNSGVVIQEIQPDREQQLQSDLVAGMLTAIRSFAQDCIASGSELDTIDYGDWQIPIEVAGYCYIAVVVKGEPSPKYRDKIRQTLSEIVIKYGDKIQNYNGDTATIPDAVYNLLTRLIETDNPQSQTKSSPTALIWLLAIIFGMIFVPWGIVSYRAQIASRIERETAVQLDAAPELSVYRLDPEVERGKLTLVGRVPNQELRNKASQIVQPIATRANLELDNQIVAVDVPVGSNSIKNESQRLTEVFNRQPNIAISTEYQAQTLTIRGFILNDSDLKTVYSAFEEIPGIKTVVVAVDKQLPNFEQRIYFKENSAQLNPINQGDTPKINNIKLFLASYPQLNLRLIAHSDRQEKTQNSELKLNRLESIRARLVAEGVDSDRLKLSISDSNPPLVDNSQPLWLSRCVRFEPYIPTNRKN